MSDRPRQREAGGGDALAAIHAKLDRLDEAIRGNGKPGINLRLELLEADAASRRRLLWIVLGALASAGVSAAAQIIGLVVRH